MKAVIYARISTNEQSNYSLGAQVEECRAFIEKERYELTNIYIDDGYSAKNTNRPQLQQMLSDLKQRKFNIIVIWRLDRLTRDTMDGLNMVKNEFKPNGVEFVSINEDIDTTSPDGYMMFTIRLSMAQAEREKIAERVSMGVKARARKGLRTNGSVPYGYNLKDDLKLEINEDEAQVVKQIYEWYLAGNGKFKIANMLTSQAIPTKTGLLHWHDAVVSSILSSPTVYGATYLNPKGSDDPIIVKGTHEGIISESTFNEAQKIKKRKQEGLMSTSSYDFPFSKIAKCAECGGNYYGQRRNTKAGSVTRSYRCISNIRKRRCIASDISEPKMYDLFKRFLDNFEFVTNDPNKSIDGKDVAKDIKKLTKLIEDATTKKKNYTRAMGSGKLDYDMFSELMEEENAKVETWKEELETLNTMVPNTTRTKSDVARSINELTSNWDSMTHNQRKLIVQQLFEAIVIKKEGKYWHVVGYKLSE